MTRIITTKRKRPEVADILRKHIGDYQKQYPLWSEHRKIVYDLLNCRTAYLGGHIERCSHCGAMRITYHSCRNRHCPTCQHIPRERWLEKRRNEILPVQYFHVVFTLPHELNAVVLNHKKVMLSILFKAVSQTLLEFGQNAFGGKPGFIATLHTWDQQLNAHFHLHCLVAGGALSRDGSHWTPCKGDYLFNEKALSLVFRGKFMDQMSKAHRLGHIKLAKQEYNRLKSRLYEKNWIIDVRDPVEEPEHVLQYLARYTYRVAIANSRITAFKDATVTFKIKNRKKGRKEQITIPAVEFIRRFLLHSLPPGFVRIRHYGFLANKNRSANLKAIRKLMRLPAPPEKQTPSVERMMRRLTGIDIARCPCCGKGTMRLFLQIPEAQARPPNPLAFQAA